MQEFCTSFASLWFVKPDIPALLTFKAPGFFFWHLPVTEIQKCDITKTKVEDETKSDMD